MRVKRKAIGYLANFFCGLHDLIHIAEAAEKAIAETEKVLVTTNVQEDVRGWTNETMTVRLIRTCCKAFVAEEWHIGAFYCLRQDIPVPTRSTQSPDCPIPWLPFQHFV